MKILITGATGLVGRAIVERARSAGITVHYLTTSKDKIVKETDYKGYYWNVNRQEIDVEAFDGVDTIIHLAGANIAQRWTPEAKKRIIHSRVRSASLLYETVDEITARSITRGQEPPIKRIIGASAIGAYPSSLDTLYTEDYANYGDDFLGEVVQKWEQSVLRFKELGLDTALVRIGIVLAKEAGALPKMAQPVKYWAGAPLGSGKQWQSVIHVEDLARLFLHVLEKDLTGVYNGVSPCSVTNKELTQAIAKQLKKPLFLPPVPAFVLHLMLGEMKAVVLQSQKVSSQKIENTGFSFQYPDITQMLAAIYN